MNLGEITYIIVVSLNIVLADQDFLEYYKPRPDLPRELNEWLSFVQQHKQDFKAIKNIVKRRNREQNYYDEIEESQSQKLLENEEDEYIDEAPHNDIYPHFKQEFTKDSALKPDSTLQKQQKSKKFNKFKNSSHKSSRPRRHSSNEHFFETLKVPVVEPNSKNGEIERSGNKFPEESYQQKNNDKYNKRELQINVLKDGKLIKSIEENTNDSKSLVFNIAAINDKENGIEKINKKISSLESPTKIDNSQNNLLSGTIELFNKKEEQEKVSNYNNLFSANKKLNTDKKIAKNSLNEILPMFDVKPSPISLIHQPLELNELPFSSDVSNSIRNQGVPEKQNQFSANSFKDMSKFWTDSEKDRLQKGIKFAQDNRRLKNGIQDDVKISEGFEPAKSIVIESSPNKHSKVALELQKLSLRQNSDSAENYVPMNNFADATILEGEQGILDKNLDIKKYGDENTRHKENVDVYTTDQKDTKQNKIFNNDELCQKNADTAADILHINKETEENNNNNCNSNIGTDNLNVGEKFDTSNTETYINTNSSFTINLNHILSGIANTENQNLGEKYVSTYTVYNSNEGKMNKDISNSLRQNENEEKVPYHSNIHTGHENINNHIDITIIEPDRNIKPDQTQEEAFKKNHKNIDIANEESDVIRDPNSQNNEIKNLNDQYDEEIKSVKDSEQKNNEEEPTDKSLSKGGDNEGCEDHKSAHKVETEFFHPQKFLKSRYRNKNHIDQRTKNEEDVIREREPASCQGDQCDISIQRQRHHSKTFRKRKYRHSNENRNKDLYKSRQLKSDYAYDTDMDGPVDEEYVNEEQVTSKREHYVAINKKGAVEGDYGDEEDSIPSKSQKLNQIVKKTDNVFANPQTVPPSDEEDESYYYEEENKPNNKTVNGTQSVNLAAKDHKSGFGHRRQHKPKPAPNPKKEKPQQKEISNKSKSFVREPRSQNYSEELLPIPKVDRQHRDKFEKLYLGGKQMQNKFPLSSKGFFTNTNEKRSDPQADVPVDKSPNLDSPTIDVDGLSKSANLVLNNTELKPTTLFNFNEVPGVSVSSTIPSEIPTEACEETTPVSIGNMCENETFVGNPVVVTTILSIIPDVQQEMNSNYSVALKNETFEKLDEVLTGKLPISLVSSVYDHLKTHPTFKARFYSGLRRHHHRESSSDFDVLNQQESRKLVNVMEDIINKLQWTTNCQKLPYKYKQYLKSITKAKSHDALSKTKQMEEVDFDDSQETKNFIFHEASAASSIEQKIKSLHEMLEKFDQLPESCKARAEPVKKYIENHMAMLNKVQQSKPRSRLNKTKESESPNNHETQNNPETQNEETHQQPIRRNNRYENNDLVEQQLESLGLGKSHQFKPNFDLDNLVLQSRIAQKVTKEGKDRTQTREWKKRPNEI